MKLKVSMSCGGPMASHLGEFGNSGSELGSVYIRFWIYLSCFAECWGFSKENKGKEFNQAASQTC